jgi:tetratricopeptide (TPR) repeat protein
VGYARPDYLGDIASLLAFLRERYVGRERELARIDEFLAQPAGGYLLVQAPGGFGKSVLVGQLVDRALARQLPGRPALVCCFLRMGGAQNTTVAFLQAVNAQLLGLLDLPGGTPPGVVELRVQFSELWSEATRRVTAQRPLLLVVDGLDEMAGGDVTVADVLPSALGGHVHVVVSSRSEPDPRQAVGGEHPLRTATVLDLRAFGEESIRELAASFGLDETIVSPARILALTGGEPLFARFVCDAIARRGPGELRRLEEGPPTDADDFFRGQLAALADAELGDMSWEVLGTLVAAYGGMTDAELAEVLDQPLRKLRAALKPVRRYLIGDERLAIFHKRLSDLVAGEFSAAERRQRAERMLAWCRGYDQRAWPPETPGYVLDWCAQHYLAADPPAAVALPSRAWLERHRQSTGSATGFIRDVEVAIGAADDVITEVRLCLIGANAVAMASVVPAEALQVLVRTGSAAEATARAALAGGNTARARALTEVARGHAARGNETLARTALTDAIHELEQEKYKSGDFVPVFLGLVECAAGDRALLLRLNSLVRSIELTWAIGDLATCVGAVAGALAGTGETATAREAVRWAIEDVPEDDGALGRLAVVAGDLGLTDLLERLDAWLTDLPGLAGVAEGWARAGDPGRSQAAAARLAAPGQASEDEEDAIGRAAAAVELLGHPTLITVRRALTAQMVALLVARGLQGFGPEAEFSTPFGVGRERDPFGAGYAVLARVIAACGAAGGYAALARIEALVDDDTSYLYGNLARAYAVLGDSESTLRCFQRMKLYPWLIDNAATSAARALVAAGALNLARRIADMTVGTGAKAAVLAAVARALLDAGDEPGAVSTARTAIHAAESFVHDDSVAAVLAVLVAVMTQPGDGAEIDRTLDLAVTYLGRVHPGARNPGLTRHVIEALVARHRFDDALRIADDEYPDLLALAGISAGMARAGQLVRAVELAERVAADAEETRERIEVLVAAADAFRAAGHDDRAESCLHSATVSPDHSGFGRLALITGLRAAGHDAEAVEAAHSLAGQPDVTPTGAAQLLAAAGLDTEAAERARAALASPPEEPFSDEVELLGRSEAAALLPRDEAVAELKAVRGAATDIRELDSRAEVLATVAARLHPLEPSLAADTLRHALLPGRLAGRLILMDVLGTGPVADLDADLPAQIARWIPEIDAWWAE